MKFYQGWYTLKNPDKFVPPEDNYMKSFNESTMQVQYKSGLELKSFDYADNSDSIEKWSVEPFPIQYLKPTDEMAHRYFPDLLIKFKSGKTVLVEVKPHSQTIPPKPPKKQTPKSEANYKKALITYSINQEKWKAAEEFCSENGMKFMLLTDKLLK